MLNMNNGRPWLMDLISMVLGILSSGLGCTDLRLTLDLNRVFMRVDFPRPLCPKQENPDTDALFSLIPHLLSENWRRLKISWHQCCRLVCMLNVCRICRVKLMRPRGQIYWPHRHTLKHTRTFFFFFYFSSLHSGGVNSPESCLQYNSSVCSISCKTKPDGGVSPPGW